MTDNQIFQKQRTRMVDKQIHLRGIQSEIVLSAMQKVPRHEFVPSSQINEAYEDQDGAQAQEHGIGRDSFIVCSEAGVSIFRHPFDKRNVMLLGWHRVEALTMALP